MIVNVTNLKQEVKTLNNIIDSYEEIYLNMYNEYSYLESFWSDPNSKKFFSDINSYRLKINNTINEVKSLEEIYKYIIESYEKIGSVCIYDLSIKDDIISKTTNFIDKLNNIITKYKNLDLTSCDDVEYIIQKEKQILQENLNKANILLNDIKSFYEKTSEIDREVNSRLLKLNIEIIKENITEEYI